jgi:hypothetical protein
MKTIIPIILGCLLVSCCGTRSNKVATRDYPFYHPTRSRSNSTMLTRADVERRYGPLVEEGLAVSTGAGVIEHWWTKDRQLISVFYSRVHSPRRSPDDILQGDPTKVTLVKVKRK